jgi:hypothetical protein
MPSERDDFISHVWTDEAMEVYHHPIITPQPAPERRSAFRVLLDILYTLAALVLSLVVVLLHAFIFWFLPLMFTAWLVLKAFHLASLI